MARDWRTAPRLSGLSRKRASAIAVALLVMNIGTSAGVGFAAEGRGFNWDVASIFGTAVGTTLLAIGTLALAYSTWQDVRASQRIAEATRRSLELAEEDREERLRPAVVGTVTGVGSDSEGVFLSLELNNIGGGPALRIDVTAEYRGTLARPHRGHFADRMAPSRRFVLRRRSITCERRQPRLD